MARDRDQEEESDEHEGFDEALGLWLVPSSHVEVEAAMVLEGVVVIQHVLDSHKLELSCNVDG